MLFLPHLAFSFHRGEPAACNEQDKTEIQDLSVYFLIDCLPSQETAGIKRVTVKILELYFLHGHMIRLFIPQISEKGNISRTDRSSLLSPDPAGHRALQLHARGRNGLIPARWGLDRQLPSPEKGFSVEAELAEFKLALWLARRPSEIICTPSILPGWGHSGGRGRAAQGFIAPSGAKRSRFLHGRFAGSLCAQGLLLRQPVQYLTYHACILPQQFRPVSTRNRCQIGIWNFPGRPRGLLLPRRLW